jgi:uncharacterized protein YjbI with pentapeptide repeats
MKLNTLFLVVALAIGAGSSIRAFFQPFRLRANWNTVRSYDPADLAESAELVSALEALNQSGRSLHELNLSRADLVAADLPRANLHLSALRNAELRRANLRRANLSQTDLRAADLSHAELTRTNLNQANLREANLYSANLRRTISNQVSFDRAILEAANFDRANLSGASFHQANLSATSIDRANLSHADLSLAKNLTETQLSTARLCQTSLPEEFQLDANRDCGHWEVAVSNFQYLVLSNFENITPPKLPNFGYFFPFHLEIYSNDWAN